MKENAAHDLRCRSIAALCGHDSVSAKVRVFAFVAFLQKVKKAGCQNAFDLSDAIWTHLYESMRKFQEARSYQQKYQ